MKKLFACVLILLMVSSLSGCHGKRNDETTGFVVPESFDESRTYEITFWAKNDNNINDNYNEEVYNNDKE